MPWFNLHGSGNKALLTTAYYTEYYPSGSIIWGDTDRFPAYWIRFEDMMDPRVIWYWVNEDDCDADRKPGQINFHFCYCSSSLVFTNIYFACQALLLEVL